MIGFQVSLEDEAGEDVNFIVELTTGPDAQAWFRVDPTGEGTANGAKLVDVGQVRAADLRALAAMLMVAAEAIEPTRG